MVKIDNININSNDTDENDNEIDDESDLKLTKLIILTYRNTRELKLN